MNKTKWRTGKSFKKDIDGFFSRCEEEGIIATRVSLAVYLGLTKDEFLKMSRGEYDTKKVKFSRYLHLADVKIEQFMEKLLFTKEKGQNAVMFYLKSHFGWSDKHEEEKEKDQSLSVNISVVGEGEI